MAKRQLIFKRNSKPRTNRQQKKSIAIWPVQLIPPIYSLYSMLLPMLSLPIIYVDVDCTSHRHTHTHNKCLSINHNDQWPTLSIDRYTLRYIGYTPTNINFSIFSFSFSLPIFLCFWIIIVMIMMIIISTVDWLIIDCYYCCYSVQRSPNTIDTHTFTTMKLIDLCRNAIDTSYTHTHTSLSWSSGKHPKSKIRQTYSVNLHFLHRFESKTTTFWVYGIMKKQNTQRFFRSTSSYPPCSWYAMILIYIK